MAQELIRLTNSASVKSGCTAFISAITPATCGAAMDVPCENATAGTRTPLPSSATGQGRPKWTAGCISRPGAAITAQGPQVEALALVACGLVALTPITPSEAAG